MSMLSAGITKGGKLRRGLLMFLLGCLVLSVGTKAYAEVRVLVLAVGYGQVNDQRLALKNTLIDARAIGAMFRSLGTHDVRIIEEPTLDILAAEVDSFAARLSRDDVALIYYAGHAIQVSGHNYFLTADGVTLVAVEQILTSVMTRVRGTVFVIDACRNNPFVRESSDSNRQLRLSEIGSGTSRALQTISRDELEASAVGLSQISNLRGTNAVVFFSTDPGNVALDGEAGQGSPFAKVIVREFAKRQSLDAAIRAVTADVNKATAGQQSPWRQGDLGFSLFLAGQPRFPVP